MSFRGARLQHGGIYIGAAEVFNKSMKGIKVLKTFLWKVHHWLGLKEFTFSVVIQIIKNLRTLLSGKKWATFSGLNQAFYFPSHNSQSHLQVPNCPSHLTEGWDWAPSLNSEASSDLMESQKQERRDHFSSSLSQPELYHSFSTWQMSLFTLSTGRGRKGNIHKIKGTNNLRTVSPPLCDKWKMLSKHPIIYLHSSSAWS